MSEQKSVRGDDLDALFISVEAILRNQTVASNSENAAKEKLEVPHLVALVAKVRKESYEPGQISNRWKFAPAFLWKDEG